MVAQTPDVLGVAPASLPEGTDETALLDAFISCTRSLIAICTDFGITLGQFEAWLGSPRIRAALDAAARLTAHREPFLEAARHETVIRGFSAICKALPPHDPAAPPDLKRDALHARMRETARKAAGQLLKVCSGWSPPTHTHGTGVPPVATEPPVSARAAPGRDAGRTPPALARAMDTRHPLAAAAGR